MQRNRVRDSESLRIHRRFRDSEGFSQDSPRFMQIRWDSSGVATIEATEAAASVKNVQQFRLSRPEFWHPEFFYYWTALLYHT